MTLDRDGLRNIPIPFRNETFHCFQEGIYDDRDVKVMINAARDFAFLCPQPVVDYINYSSRVKKLALEKYKARLEVYSRRYEKVAPFVRGASNLLEIGAGDGSFLKIVHDRHPHTRLATFDTDVSTREERMNAGAQDFDSLDTILNTNQTYDVVCMFHVLEHLTDPTAFLSRLHQLLANHSTLIVEVPSLADPLLSLYDNEPYKRFYFQKQHPYVYSHTSLERLLTHNGFDTLKVIGFQRYGLDNHLNWLAKGKPGGNPAFSAILPDSSRSYIAELECSENTDSAIWLGKRG